ncbi:hypothetical protein D3C73_680160 [compost metagenome]
MFAVLAGRGNVGGNTQDSGGLAAGPSEHAFGGQVSSSRAVLHQSILEMQYSTGFEHFPVVLAQRLGLLSGQVKLPRLALHCFKRNIGGLLEHAVAKPQFAFGVVHVDERRSVFDDLQQQGLLGLQGFLGFFPVGDIAHHGVEHRFVSQVHRAQRDFGRENAAIAALVQPFETVHTVYQCCFQHGLRLDDRQLPVALQLGRNIGRTDPVIRGGIIKTENTHRRRVGLGANATPAQNPDGIGGALEQRAKTRLTVAQ